MAKILFCLIVSVLFLHLVRSLDKEKHCKCRIRTESRIIGGRVAHHTDYPWSVSLSINQSSPSKSIRDSLSDRFKVSSHNCGGVILNNQYILTAGHCVARRKAQFWVGIGNQNDLVKIYDATRIKVKRVVLHPKFGKLSKDIFLANDIALLEIEPITFTKNVLPGCLDTNLNANYGDVMIIGYGLTSKVYKNKVTKETFRGLKSSPMHKTIKGTTRVIGLTSGSNYKIKENGLEVLCNGEALYTRVAYYLDWIEETIGKDHC